MTVPARKPLILLGTAAYLAACVLAAVSGMARLREVSRSVDRYRSRLADIESRSAAGSSVPEALLSGLEAEVLRLEEEARGSDTETDLAMFGMRVRRELLRAGAAVRSYQGLGGSDDPESSSARLLEVSARGSPLALSRFLLSAARRGWNIPFLSVRSDTDAASVEFALRIGYAP